MLYLCKIVTFLSHLLDFIRKHKGMAHHLFAGKKVGNLNAHQVTMILKPAFSLEGNQRRIKEEIVMTKFIALMKSIEGKVFFN